MVWKGCQKLPEKCFPILYDASIYLAQYPNQTTWAALNSYKLHCNQELGGGLLTETLHKGQLLFLLVFIRVN